ncbi:MAG: low-complexity tail membrane protein [Cyanobacteria bacterium P01_G01_bin.54]
MRINRQDPYLWLHIAGLAVLPLWGLVLWLGVAAGEPWFPYGVEEALLVVLGAAPWLWVQWQRPFNPFSVLAIALTPNCLTPEQRQWLQVLKGPRTRIVAVLAVLPAVWWLGQCYRLAPLAISVTPIPNHGLGLLVAAIAFSGANLFLQVSLSMVGLLLLTSEQQFAAAKPYAVDRIGSDFFRFGPQLPQILPPLKPIAPPVTVEPESPEPETVEPETQNPETPSAAAAEDNPVAETAIENIPEDPVTLEVNTAIEDAPETMTNPEGDTQEVIDVSVVEPETNDMAETAFEPETDTEKTIEISVVEPKVDTVPESDE